MKIRSLFLTATVCGIAWSAQAGPGTEYTQNFDDVPNGELPKGWVAQFGDWQVQDGVLIAKQVPADNHGAAARAVLPMQDGEFRMKFRLQEGAGAFHFGFDPAKGELDKKGHLFSVVVTPGKWSILKHVDKNQPKEDPNEVLAVAEHRFEIGTWYELVLTKQGDVAKASIEGVGALEATHPTFHVKTPTLVFRSIGKGAVEVDEVAVTAIE
jgi:hypothetical protein